MKASFSFNKILIRGYAQAIPKVEDKFKLQVGQSKNGLTVITVNPAVDLISKVALVFNAGSRFEDNESRGFNHLLRRSFGLSSGNLTSVSVIRHFQQMGARVRCVGTRETLSYQVDFNKSISGKLMELLGQATTMQNFYMWDLKYHVTNYLKTDRDHLNYRDKEGLLSELLHEAAFGNGLGNSLFMDECDIGHYNIDKIESFIKRTCSATKAMLVGVSMDHSTLLREAEFFHINPLIDSKVPKQIFRGGQLRRRFDSNFSRVAIGWAAPGLNDTKSNLAAVVLAHAIDNGLNQRIRWNNGDYDLLKKVSKSTAMIDNVDANSFVYNYSDCTLLGFTMVSDNPDVNGEAVSTLFKHFVNQGKNGVSQQDFDHAKQALIVKLCSSLENRELLLDLLISQACCTNNIQGMPELVEAVNSVTLQEVNAVGQKIFSNNKVAMSAVGNISGIPYLEDLSA